MGVPHRQQACTGYQRKRLMLPTYEQLEWAAEFCGLLPHIYAVKLWQAHTEFMEDLLNVIPRA